MHPILPVLLLMVLMTLISACGTGELTSGDCDNPAVSHTADCPPPAIQVPEAPSEPTPLPVPTIPSDVPPTAPTTLAILSKTDHSIHVTWVDTATNEQTVMIERRDASNTGGDSGYEVIATLGENVTGYQDNSLSAATNYCYRVKSSNAAGESAYSDSLCETTNETPLLAPEIPTEFTVTASQTRLNVVLTWTTVANASEYDIERSVDTPTSFVPIVTLEAGAQTYIDTKDLEKETEYWYRLRATNAAGESAYTNPQKGISPGDPDPVTHLTGVAKVDSPSITLNWTNPDNMLSLDLQRKENTGDDYQSIAIFDNATQSTYVDTNVTLGTTYYYQMVTTNEMGSVRSETVEMTIPTAAPKPLNIKATANTDNLGAKLSWELSIDILNYRIERSLSKEGPYADVSGLLAADITEFTDINLSSNITYYYRIYAISKFGENFIETSIVTPNLPDVPQNFDIIATVDPASITLNWGVVENAEHYRLERTIDRNCCYVVIQDFIPQSRTSYVDSDRIYPNTSYFYRLYSVNTIGESLLQGSNVIQQDVPPIPPPPVGGAPFSYGGWFADNGRISGGSDFICNSGAFSCSRIADRAGFYQVRVNPRSFSTVPSDNVSYILTIFTNLGAYGYPDQLDYYHVNTSTYSFSDLTTAIKTHSERRGVSTPQSLASMVDHGYELKLMSVDNVSDIPDLDPGREPGPNVVIVAKIDDIYYVQLYHRDVGRIDFGEYSPDSVLFKQLDDVFNTNLQGKQINPDVRHKLLEPFISSIHEIPNHNGDRLLFQGKITGVLVSEYNVLTDQTIQYSSAKPFSVNFTYNANATAMDLDILERNIIPPGTYFESGIAYKRALHPAIISLEIASGDKIWKSSMGYINSFEEATAYTFNFDKVMMSRTAYYYIAAYANPFATDNGNNNEFFGLDFHGYKAFGEYEKINLPPIIKTQLANPPSGNDFQQMGLSIYLDEGITQLVGVVSSFDVMPVDLPLTELPAAPLLLYVRSKGENEIDVIWADTASNEQYFIIERQYIDGSWGTAATLNANTTEYQDSALTAGTNYCYRIKASNATGVTYSNVMCNVTYPIPQDAPEVPTNFGTIVDGPSLNYPIVWSSIPNQYETYHEIERSIDTPSSFIQIAKLPGIAQNFFEDENLMKNTVYWYRMRTVNSAGASDYTTPFSVTTARDPDLVTDLVGIANTENSSMALSWTNPDNHSSLVLQRKDNSLGDYQNIVAIANTTQSTYEDTNLTTGTTYFYRMVSVNYVGSANSEILEVTLPTVP